MRHYYEVFVAGRTYHSQKSLTYFSQEKLLTGSIVSLELKQEAVLGLVDKEVKPPAFTTKPLQALPLPPLPIKTIELIKWLKQYYPSPFGTIVQLFLPNSRITKLSHQKSSELSNPIKVVNLPKLTDEQKKVLTAINKPATYLLHGKTGSGKTRIYQELAIQTIKNGKSVIVLTPEISLTSQLNRSFEAIFGKRVVILHSHLSPTDRREIWLKILNSPEPLIVIGARSALFSPLNDIGLIVVDEAHETAYKQEQAPYYYATRVASKLANLHGSILILGSATPSVVDYFMATQKQSPILTMQKLATSNQEPKIKVEVVDIKNRSQFTQRPHLSNQLLTAVDQAIKNKQQALVFMNRRGTARVVVCSNCGWQALCPICNVPLTYHGDDHILRCHICGHREVAVTKCPVCESTDILFKSAGTKALISEIQSYFPKARIQRFDSDNKKHERFELNYEAIIKGNVDILVGTQMLAKGLDLPKLSVVGVINADAGLSIPDYTAEEKTYQLISQVLGRIGRGHISGKAVIQTYEPASPLLQAAIGQDWQKFYSMEIKQRRQFKFPPFCHLLKLTCRRTTAVSATKAAEQLANIIVSKFKVEISGPAPAFHEQQSGNYEWQLVIKSSQRSELLKVIAALPSGWSYDIDPVNLL